MHYGSLYAIFVNASIWMSTEHCVVDFVVRLPYSSPLPTAQHPVPFDHLPSIARLHYARSLALVVRIYEFRVWSDRDALGVRRGQRTPHHFFVFYAVN